MQMISMKVSALALCLGVAACGDTFGEQAILGSAAGVGVAAVAGGSLLTGAAIGAAGNILVCQIGDVNCR